MKGDQLKASATSQKRDAEAQSRSTAIRTVESVRMHFDICIFMYQARMECLQFSWPLMGQKWSEIYLERFTGKNEV